MKKALTLLLLLCLMGGYGFGQCPSVGIASVGQNLSNYTTSSSYSSEAQELYVSGFFDQETFTIGGHSILGVTINDPIKWDLYLVKLTPDLTVDWLMHTAKSVGLSSSSRLCTADGGVLAAFQFVDTVSFASQEFIVENGGFYENALFMKINQQGSVEWIHQFSEVATSQINAIDVDQYGMIYMAGTYTDELVIQGQTLSVENPPFSDGEIFIAKFKANGDLVWLKHLGGGEGNDVGYSLKCADNGLFVSGFFEGDLSMGTSSLTSPSGPDGFVTAIDTAGNAEWVVHLNGTGAVRNEEVIPFKSGCVVAGWFTSTLSVDQYSVTSNGAGDFFSLRLDHNGVPIWLNNIGGEDPDGTNRLEPINDDLFMISGSCKSSFSVDGLSYVNHASAVGHENGIVLLLDSTGTVQCISEMPSMNSSSTLVEYLGGDTIALVGGFVEDLSIQNLSLSVDGTSSVIVKQCFGCDELIRLDAPQIHTNQRNLTIHPNPATTSTTLTLPDASTYNIMVVDAMGRMVYQERFDSAQHDSSFSLTTANWPNGIFAITATNKEGVLFKSKLVVQH